MSDTVQIASDFSGALRSGIAKPVRSILDFATSEIRIPPGSKYRDEKLKLERQPVQRLFLQEYDRGHWYDVVATGPSQSAKTFICFDVPIAYHIGEIQETIVVGVPDGTMANDKWVQEIRPIFEASASLRDLLPLDGPGSRGGSVRDFVKFRNGCEIRFMTRGGSDQSKAGFTARVVIVTEAAGWTAGTEVSKESDPLRQLRARQKSWDRPERLTIIEGTGTVASDYPWSLHPTSSQSRIVSPCPYCDGAISPEREHLKGWENAESEDEASALAYFVCPICNEKIDDELRIESVQQVVILHGKQQVDSSWNIIGDLPLSRRLWFRWGGWHNLFASIGSLAVEEWKKKQELPDSPAEESAERELCQFIWAVPFEEPLGDTVQIDAKVAATKKADLYAHQILPEDTTHLAVGIDLGKRVGHYVWMAGRACGRIHIPDYGEFGIAGDKMDTEIAIQQALEKFHDRYASTGLMLFNGEGKVMLPGLVLVDANYKTPAVFRAWKKLTSGRRDGQWLPIFGRGTSQMLKNYSHPKRRGGGIVQIGDHWYMSRHKEHRGWCMFIDVDHWKDAFHHHLALDTEAVGGLTLYAAPARDHMRITQAWAGEQRKEEWQPGKGMKVVWDRIKRNQHAFDASVYARVGLAKLGWSPEAGAG